MGREKILLDTDIGTEVDDAITLAYLLANPDAEIMGITTVTGDAAERARLASVLCRIAGASPPGSRPGQRAPPRPRTAGRAAPAGGGPSPAAGRCPWQSPPGR